MAVSFNPRVLGYGGGYLEALDDGSCYFFVAVFFLFLFVLGAVVRRCSDFRLLLTGSRSFFVYGKFDEANYYLFAKYVGNN